LCCCPPAHPQQCHCLRFHSDTPAARLLSTWQLTSSAQTRAVERPNSTHTLFYLQPKVRVFIWLAIGIYLNEACWGFEPERPVTASIGLITLWHLLLLVFGFSPYMIRYDIWYDRYDIWYDINMIGYDTIRYDMIWYDMIWYDMIWYDTVRYYMIW